MSGLDLLVIYMIPWIYMCCVKRLSGYGERNPGSRRVL